MKKNPSTEVKIDLQKEALKEQSDISASENNTKNGNENSNVSETPKTIRESTSLYDNGISLKVA